MQKFFCDNCGTQVKKNAVKCPHCGRFFRSVKCPSCGLTGSPDLFTNGCPSCGYAEEKLRIQIESYEPGDVEVEVGGAAENDVKKSSFFTDAFYKRAIPILLAVIVVLVILLIRVSF